MLLTLVYNTQNYWVFSLCPLSAILETAEQKDLEVVELLCSLVRRKTPTLFGHSERPVIEFSAFPPHLRTETEYSVL
jgi:hypothetical protein